MFCKTRREVDIISNGCCLFSMKKLILGIVVSVIFIYLSLRGVEFEKVLKGLKDVNPIFLLPAMVLLLLALLLRSLRWGVVLSPIERICQRRLFPITCVGTMAIILIPMRIGELIRPYLVSNESKIPLSASLATILVERVFDLLTVLSILFLVTLSTAVPQWLVKTGYGSLAILFVLLFCMLLIYFRMEMMIRCFSPLLDKLPRNFGAKIESLIHTFVAGFKIISSPKRLIYILILSFTIWGCSGLAIYTLFFFYDFQLTLVNAFVILVITVIGISLPAGPGMVGNFQFACIVALSLFGIQKSDALSFSMIYYFMAIGKIILLGLIFLPSVHFSFKNVRGEFLALLI